MPEQIWFKLIFETSKFWISNCWDTSNTMFNSVAGWKSFINRQVQLFLYFCKELHKIFALTNRWQETHSVMFLDIEQLTETNIQSFLQNSGKFTKPRRQRQRKRH